MTLGQIYMFGKSFNKAQSDLVASFLSGYVVISEGRYTTIDDLVRAFVQVTKNVRLEYHVFIKIMKHIRPRYVYRNKKEWIMINHAVQMPTSEDITIVN